MQRYIIQRHYVGDEQDLEFLERNIETLWQAIETTEYKGWNMDFGLKLTIDYERLPSGIAKRLMDVIVNYAEILDPHKTLSDPIRVDMQDRGPRVMETMFGLESFFDPNCIIANPDMDQYVLDEEGLERIEEIFARMETDGCLYGIGSRDVPVVLAHHPDNSRFREIHELFHSLFIGSNILRVEPTHPNASPAFAEIGESSGLCMINRTHPKYKILKELVQKFAKVADFTKWAPEYYMAMRASTLGAIATGYVKCVQNPTQETDVLTEKMRIERIIRKESQALGETDIGEALFTSTQMLQHEDILAEFYN
tara:strand:- start:33 stop:962 length:930 start_codon:yes stop_codon:yes gene_type:complete